MAKQLLVVDDDPGLLLAVSDTLRAEGYEVQTARRAREAMIRVAESLPDLIISDIRMPGMGGIEGVARLANLMPKVRIVMLTAYEDSEDIIHSLSAGAHGYLMKDQAAGELVNAVRSVLKGEIYLSQRLSGLMLKKL